MGCISDRIHEGNDFFRYFTVLEDQDIFCRQDNVLSERSVSVDSTDDRIRADVEIPEFALSAFTASTACGTNGRSA